MNRSSDRWRSATPMRWLLLAVSAAVAAHTAEIPKALGKALGTELTPITDRGLTPGEPASGSFLVASQTLRDPNFERTVILLIDHDHQGAMGLIINRPTETRLSTLLPEIDALEDRQDTVWLGGPVSKWQMVLLARSDEEVEGSRNVLGDVYFSASRLVLERLAGGATEVRVYAGHAGWAPGQLEGEILRGGWHVLPGDPEMVFDQAPLELWGELVRRSKARWAAREEPLPGPLQESDSSPELATPSED